jgi:hypothetical protein
MSYFHKLDETLEESEQERAAEKHSAGSRLADLGDRIARAFTAVDRGRAELPALEPSEAGPFEAGPFETGPFETGPFETEPGATEPGEAEPGETGRGQAEPQELTRRLAAAEPDFAPRFATAAFGYSRAAVDGYIAELERELQELRRGRPEPVSITEEIERIGEQTASILVVAHDQAHETTRRAQEQADRCIADAAANAVQITERARQQLRELDGETDAVWRERNRLLEDAQSTGSALISLAHEATQRFPEDTRPEETKAMDAIRFEE